MFANGDKVVVRGKHRGVIMRQCRIYEFMTDGTSMKGRGFIVSCEDGFLRSCGLTEIAQQKTERREVT